MSIHAVFGYRIESQCCSEFQCCQFLLVEITESAEEEAICVTSHLSFVPYIDRGMLELYFTRWVGTGNSPLGHVIFVDC